MTSQHPTGMSSRESPKTGVAEKDGTVQPLRKALGGSVVGTIVEYYDFSIYGYMATVLAGLFFSTGDPAPPCSAPWRPSRSRSSCAFPVGCCSDTSVTSTAAKRPCRGRSC